MGTYFIEEKGYTLLLGCWKLPLSYKMQAHCSLMFTVWSKRVCHFQCEGENTLAIYLTWDDLLSPLCMLFLISQVGIRTVVPHRAVSSKWENAHGLIVEAQEIEKRQFLLLLAKITFMDLSL